MVPDGFESAVEAEIIRQRIDSRRSKKILSNTTEYVRILRAVREHRWLQAYGAGHPCLRTSRYRPMDSVAAQHHCRRVRRSDGTLRPDTRRSAGEQLHYRTAFELVRETEPATLLEG